MLLVGPTRTEMPQTEQRFKQPTEHVSVSQVKRLCPHFTPLNPPPSFSLLSATIQYLSRLPPQLSPLPLSSSPSLIPSTRQCTGCISMEWASCYHCRAGWSHSLPYCYHLTAEGERHRYIQRERERELQNVTEVSLLSSVICRSIIHISLSN